MNYLQQHLNDLGANYYGSPYDCIAIPLEFPRNNDVLKWLPVTRKVAVQLIKEAVRVSAENVFTKHPTPKFSWEWEECWLANKMVKWDWFVGRWKKIVLCDRKVMRPESWTFAELHRTRTGLHHIHVHSVRARLTDPDGISSKALLDGLVSAGFFPDDNRNYIHGVTHSQEKSSEFSWPVGYGK